MEITYTEMYQLFFLKRSINEQLELYDENKKKYLINNINIKIDHIPGDCYINDMKKLLYDIPTVNWAKKRISYTVIR